MNEDCPIHCVWQRNCPYCNEWEVRHHRRWAKLMIVGIAVGTTLPVPINIFQIITCGWTLLWKLDQLDQLYGREP